MLQSSVHTVGGVVAPGEQIMLIVPQAEALKERKTAHKSLRQTRLLLARRRDSNS